MSDSKNPPPGPGTSNWVEIISVYPGDCIGLSAQVWVDYSNATTVALAVGLGCGGAGTPPDQMVGPGTGTCKFLLNHTAAATGHTVTATLKQRASVLAADSVSPVGIGNPCPVSVSGIGEIAYGFPSVSLQKPLSGTFDRKLGDRVLVLVERAAPRLPALEPKPGASRPPGPTPAFRRLEPPALEGPSTSLPISSA